MLNLVIAHRYEALPLIGYYQLTRQRHHAFTMFEKDQIRLVVCGQGRQNAAAGTAWLGGIENASGHSSSVWINFGVGGHRDHPVGSLWRMNKITDAATGRSYYPIRIGKSSAIPGCAVRTVDDPETDYDQDCLYDMEVSSFYATASRFSTREKIHSLKMVSDNLIQPPSGFNPSALGQLINVKINEIVSYINSMYDICNQNNDVQDHDFLKDLVNKFHSTHSQKKQLVDLLLAARIHGIATDVIINNSRDAQALISRLTTVLESTELEI